MIYSLKVRALIVSVLSFAFLLPGLPVYSQNSVSEQSAVSSVETDSAGKTAYEQEGDIKLNSQNSDSGNDFIRRNTGVSALLRMVLVLALIVFVLWLIFKFMKKSTQPGVEDDPFLRKVSHITLSPGKTVQIVTLIDHAYVLGVSDDNVQLIEKLDDKELINALNVYADKTTDNPKPKSFAELLDIFMPKKNKEASSKAKAEKPKKSRGTIVDPSVTSMISSLRDKRLKNGDEK